MNILDPRFKYIPSHQTDIRETFARARAQMACANETSNSTSPAESSQPVARSEKSSGSDGAEHPTVS